MFLRGCGCLCAVQLGLLCRLLFAFTSIVLQCRLQTGRVNCNLRLPKHLARAEGRISNICYPCRRNQRKLIGRANM
ncbi:hypothetical protein BOTBODRAFT_35074 [Botryobasidium botryosum FD-172 SS1]|uniref:Uncharacterized protein n=1 Tax=Botryobasidium botryosum (strain FD-172 SS1) TaxID=930990 RepID=A0A067MAZ1_BOTB1|nr:hypothetical protein BOTBODRAFT_35074 [Botryobasidium botryosum FD-172 SS1]